MKHCGILFPTNPINLTSLTMYIPYYLANTLPSQQRPPPPPNSFDENYCAGTIISEDSDCDYNLCNVYKILYYAAVYVRGHFC